RSVAGGHAGYHELATLGGRLVEHVRLGDLGVRVLDHRIDAQFPAASQWPRVAERDWLLPAAVAVRAGDLNRLLRASGGDRGEGFSRVASALLAGGIDGRRVADFGDWRRCCFIV